MTGVQSRHPKSCAEGSWRRGGAAAIACLALGVVFCARPAVAETLVEALSNAYLINPVLNAERANLRATDEQVAVAKSGLRPNISASGDAAFQNQESDIVGGSQKSTVQKCDAATAALEPAFCASLASQTNVGNIESQLSSDGVTHPRGYSVTLSQTVFQGFQNINAIRQAKATVQAGREGLRGADVSREAEAARTSSPSNVTRPASGRSVPASSPANSADSTAVRSVLPNSDVPVRSTVPPRSSASSCAP